MKATFRIVSLLALAALGGTACGRCAAADPPPKPDELLKEYKSLGLPLPPEKAKLVRYEGWGGRIGSDGKPLSPILGLSFEIKPTTETGHAILMKETAEWKPDWDPHPKEVKPEAAAIEGIDLDPDHALVLAIFCESRGWRELANALLKKCEREAVALEDRLPLKKRILHLAWQHWESQLSHPTLDRSLATKKLKELLKKDTDLNGDYHRELVMSAELALVPGKGKPGSVEALIDGLVDEREYGQGASRRLIDLGFDAVPALLEHLGDRRLTRSKSYAFNNFKSWNYRVGDLVDGIISNLADEELARGEDGKEVGKGAFLAFLGWSVTKAAATAWWEKARKVGEEKYLMDRILPTRNEDGGPVGISSHLLRVLSAKYPKQLPGLYKTILEKRPDVKSEEFADVFAKSKAPAKAKIELFALGAKHKDFNHRHHALAALRNLDQKQFDALLLETIESFPKDVKGPYWLSIEVSISRQAIDSTDPKIWVALEKVARRSSLGLRMEILNELGNPGRPECRVERMRLFGAFLDDPELRDEKSDKRLEGPGAGFYYRRIEVRDFVAVQLGGLLGIEVEVDRERSPKEWAKIRDKIRETLKRELDKSK